MPMHAAITTTVTETETSAASKLPVEDCGLWTTHIRESASIGQKLQLKLQQAIRHQSSQKPVAEEQP